MKVIKALRNIRPKLFLVSQRNGKNDPPKRVQTASTKQTTVKLSSTKTILIVSSNILMRRGRCFFLNSTKSYTTQEGDEELKQFQCVFQTNSQKSLNTNGASFAFPFFFDSFQPSMNHLLQSWDHSNPACDQGRATYFGQGRKVRDHFLQQIPRPACHEFPCKPPGQSCFLGTVKFEEQKKERKMFKEVQERKKKEERTFISQAHSPGTEKTEKG